MNPLIFREYDIRGIVDTDLTDAVVEDIGRACGSYLRRRGKRRISVGGDCRLSTERFRTALIRGLRASGCDVINIGVCTTPILYFSIFHHGYEGGIMITGSHNPPHFNGFKVCAGTETLHGDEIQELQRIIEQGDFESGSGTVDTADVVTAYKEFLISKFSFARKLRVAIDAGNGTAGEVILPVLARLGVTVVPLNCTMDGRFPVHHPDPTVPENLEQMIAEITRNGLDCGIAFDGDGDRLGVVNEKGEIIWGDKLLLLYARDILKHSPGATIISEVKSSKYLYEDIKQHGGNGIMWKTGHSVIKAKIKETHAALAGEVSGHMFFADRYYGYDDAIYAALRLLEILDRSAQPLSSLLADVPPSYVTPEIRLPCVDKHKFAVIEKIKQQLAGKYTFIDIDGIRILFDDGWGLIRASNTQPVLVMRIEADTPARLREIQQLIERAVHAAVESMQ